MRAGRGGPVEDQGTRDGRVRTARIWALAPQGKANTLVESGSRADCDKPLSACSHGGPFEIGHSFDQWWTFCALPQRGYGVASTIPGQPPPGKVLYIFIRMQNWT